MMGMGSKNINWWFLNGPLREASSIDFNIGTEISRQASIYLWKVKIETPLMLGWRRSFFHFHIRNRLFMRIYKWNLKVIHILDGKKIKWIWIEINRVEGENLIKLRDFFSLKCVFITSKGINSSNCDWLSRKAASLFTVKWSFGKR